jgi:UDP-hydrolysing UDP-N-acetyl-D-glucosamine 2-epimerase
LKRKICVVLTTRGNYAKMKSTMAAVRRHPSLELQTVLAGGIVQDAFGDYAPVLAADGFSADAVVDFLVGEGATLAAMTDSAGRAVSMLGAALLKMRPDCVLVIADRYEALSLALAATCGNIVIAHHEGGEVSGSIDERLRHAITKLAQIHLPANAEAAARIAAMGESPESIHVVGTPSLDLLAELDLADRSPLFAFQETAGDGAHIDYTKPYVVVSQHPVVTEIADAASQIWQTAEAVVAVGAPAIWLLPNMDAGRADIVEAIDALRKRAKGVPICFFRSMPFELYAVLLANAACLAGNSSSGIRESAFLGVPAVNIGTRQEGRQRGRNVFDVKEYRAAPIAAAMQRQIAHGRYASDPIYGDGKSGERIAHVLATVPFELDKRPRC